MRTHQVYSNAVSKEVDGLGIASLAVICQAVVEVQRTSDDKLINDKATTSSEGAQISSFSQSLPYQ